MIGQALRRGINAHRAVVSTAPTFVTATVSRTTGATSNPVGTLSGVRAGDILVAFGGGPQTANNVTLTPPAGLGWIDIGDSGAGLGRSHVFTTTATSADQSGGTWTWSGGTDSHAVAILAYRNVVQPTAAGMTASVSATSINAASRTSVGANAILLTWAFFVTNGSLTPTWPAGMTARVTPTVTSGAGSAAEEARPTAGATGTRLFSTTNATASSGITAAAVILEAA